MKMRIGLFLVANLVLFVLAATAQSVQPNGRWEFVVTSGDTPLQLNELGQTTFSTYLLLNGTTLSGYDSNYYTTSFTGAEVYCCQESVSGTFITSGGVTTATVTFSAAANSYPGQGAFTYTFTGTYNPHPCDSHGPTITGTYTTTGVAVNYSTGGSFVATWFPDFHPTREEYVGGLSPDVGNGPTDIPTIIHLGTNAQHELIGTITTSLQNSSGVSCFVGPLTIGNTPSVSYASGVELQVNATDQDGNQLWLLGYSAAPNGDSAAVGENYLCDDTNNCTDDGGTQLSGPNAVNNGTNNELIFFYTVTGGPCDGLGGPDSPFHVVKNTHHKERQRHNR